MGMEGWDGYYRRLTASLRSGNNLKAADTAALKSAIDETDRKINKIEKNPVYRVLRGLTGGNSSSHPAAGKRDKPDPGLPGQLAYREELYRQTHPYEVLRGGNAHAPRHAPADFGLLRAVSMEGCSGGSPFEGMTSSDPGFTLFYREGSRLVEGAEGEMLSYMEKHPDRLVLYWDEDKSSGTGTPGTEPYFKPGPSPDTLISFMYTGGAVLVRNSAASEVLWEGAPEGPANVYALLLRLMLFAAGKGSGARQVLGYIPSVLSGTETGFEEFGGDPSLSSMKRKILEEYGIKAEFLPAQDPECFHAVYGFDAGEPLVSIIIPSKDHPDILERCVASIRSGTDYKRYEIIVVDNGSTEMGKKTCQRLAEMYSFKYIYFNSSFNFSHSCNRGAEDSDGELLLFLNDDTEVIEKDWLRNMAGQAMRPQTGAVGARLLYEGTDLIQHAGVTNMAIGPSHKLGTLPDDRSYYHGINRYDRNVLAVTGACLMVRRDIFEEAGGFDERLAVAYNDIHLCMTLHDRGYMNVLRNDAVLWHDESLSRGADDENEEKRERLYDEEEYLYSKHPGLKGRDPFYSPFLSQDTVYYDVRGDFNWNDRSLRSKEVPVSPADTTLTEDGMKLNLDRAVMVKEPDRSIPDYLLVEGWGYVPGKDNSSFEKTVILKSQTGELHCYAAFPRYRKDVSAALQSQENCELSSFVARIDPEPLKKGLYSVGVMMEAEGKRYAAWEGECRI